MLTSSIGVSALPDFDLVSIATLCISIAAVILTYIDMRRRLKKEREFSKSMAKLINTLREELQLSRKKSMTKDELKRQKLLAQKEQQQWNHMKDVAKAVGWFLDRMEDAEEPEED